MPIQFSGISRFSRPMTRFAGAGDAPAGQADEDRYAELLRPHRPAKQVDAASTSGAAAAGEPAKDYADLLRPHRPAGEPAAEQAVATPDAETLAAEMEKNFVKAETIFAEFQMGDDVLDRHEVELKKIERDLLRFQKAVQTNPGYASIKQRLEKRPDDLWNLYKQASPVNAARLELIWAEERAKAAGLAKEQAVAEFQQAMAEAATEATLKAREAARRAAELAAEGANKAAHAAGDVARKAPGALVDGVRSARDLVDQLREASRGSQAQPAEKPADDAADEPGLSGPDETAAKDGDKSTVDKVADKVEQTVGDLMSRLRRRR